MTDEQIKELFDTVPAFADSCIESLRPAPFLRSISRCWSASVNTGLIYVTVNPNYPGMTWRELLDKGEKMRKNIRLFTVNPEYYLNLERLRAPFMSFCFHEGKGYVGGRRDATAPASQSSSSIRNPLHFCAAFISLRSRRTPA